MDCTPVIRPVHTPGRSHDHGTGRGGAAAPARTGHGAKPAPGPVGRPLRPSARPPVATRPAEARSSAETVRYRVDPLPAECWWIKRPGYANGGLPNAYGGEGLAAVPGPSGGAAAAGTGAGAGRSSDASGPQDAPAPAPGIPAPLILPPVEPSFMPGPGISAGGPSGPGGWIGEGAPGPGPFGSAPAAPLAVSEPSSLLLVLFALGIMALLRHRRRASHRVLIQTC